MSPTIPVTADLSPRLAALPVEQATGFGDSDADGDTLRITAVDGARHGQVVLNADGTITFTPDADYNGEAGFSYTVGDGKGGFDTAQVRVDVTPVNDAPVASGDNVHTEGVDLMGGGIDPSAAIDSLVANGNVQAQAAAA